MGEVAGTIGTPEYPALPCLKAAVSILEFVHYAETMSDDTFGVGESVARPIGYLRELVRRMEDGEL